MLFSGELNLGKHGSNRLVALPQVVLVPCCQLGRMCRREVEPVDASNLARQGDIVATEHALLLNVEGTWAWLSTASPWVIRAWLYQVRNHWPNVDWKFWVVVLGMKNCVCSGESL